MIVSGYISDNVKITKVKDHSTAGTSTVESDEIDMLGYDGVLFVTSFGTPATNNIATVEHGAVSGTVAASVALKTSGSSDEEVLVDVQHPIFRYVRLSVARGTSSTLESIYAIQYKGRSLPEDNSVTGTIAVGQFNAPASA